eukprot:CAMPEP_0202698530 /NCGR_PEP_ID=MMETSP1385-20130828/11798_1 /ASSEMBLY_ACC=CAM_ASM_000861 /TAXON_ID=933848 /ORGANISM="Elphidium margaritaceum" /LENGTH=201 /DNA_ID=CAMNT_0049355263 /DNA_START=30 /DNA_END=635 /DNA_ORIENTATION=-
MSLSLQHRVWMVSRRMAHSLMKANCYNPRFYLSSQITPPETPSSVDDTGPEALSTAEDGASALSEPDDYSHYISEKPDSEKGRKMRIFMPARPAGTQGMSKTGMWKVEPMNPGKRWGNPLMGWTSTRDPLQSINKGLEQFKNKEHAMEWCRTNGYEFEVFEPNMPRRKPKNYASTMARNGPPITSNVDYTPTSSESSDSDK